MEVVRFETAFVGRLIDITRLDRSSKYGVLWLCELAFLRIESGLLDAVKSFE